MEKESFSVGDLVKLKSGGPVMTVKSIDIGSDFDYYCQWFSGKKLETGNFDKNAVCCLPLKKTLSEHSFRSGGMDAVQAPERRLYLSG